MTQAEAAYHEANQAFEQAEGALDAARAARARAREERSAARQAHERARLSTERLARRIRDLAQRPGEPPLTPAGRPASGIPTAAAARDRPHPDASFGQALAAPAATGLVSTASCTALPAGRVRFWERIGSGDPASGAVRRRQTLRVHGMLIRLTCGNAPELGFCRHARSVRIEGVRESCPSTPPRPPGGQPRAQCLGPCACNGRMPLIVYPGEGLFPVASRPGPAGRDSTTCCLAATAGGTGPQQELARWLALRAGQRLRHGRLGPGWVSPASVMLASWYRLAGRAASGSVGGVCRAAGRALGSGPLPRSRGPAARQLEILPSRPRLRVTGSAVPGGSGFVPSTVSLMPPGLPSRMSTGCRKAHLFDVPATT